MRSVILVLLGALIPAAGVYAYYSYAFAEDEVAASHPRPPRPPRPPSKPPVQPLTEETYLRATVPVADPPADPGPIAAIPYRDVLGEHDRWFAARISAGTIAAAAGQPWAAGVEAWMADAWRRILDHPNSQKRKDLIQRCQVLRGQGCTDPTVMALDALLQFDKRTRIAQLTACLPGLEGVTRCAVLRALVHRRLANDLPATRAIELAHALDDLVAAKDAGDFTDDAGAALLLAIIEDSNDEVRPLINRFVNRLGDGKGLPAWATATLIGRTHIWLAWRHRGNGFANTVTEDGWKGFADELVAARSALEQAQRLGPGRWEPAILLLTVLMGEGGEDAAGRLDAQLVEVQKRCPDHLEASHRLMMALRPRWHGDAQTMLKHGLAWLRSDDYTGFLPWMGLAAIDTLDDDLDGSGVAYRQPGVTAAVERAAAGYLASAQAPLSAERIHGSAFRAEFLGGDYATALVHWNALGRTAEGWILSDDPRFASPFISGMCELGARHDEPAVDALIRGTAVPPLGPTLARLLEDPELTPAARTWLEALRTREEQRIRFARGEAFALPGSAGLDGWERLHGAWSVADGALVAVGDGSGHLLPWSTPVGDRFVLSGTIATSGSDHALCQAGVVFGRPKANVSDENGWASVRFRPIGSGQVGCEIGNGFGRSRDSRIAQVADIGRFRFRVAVREQRCTVEIDGSTVFDRVPLPAGLVLDGRAVVGLGGYTVNRDVTIRYQGLLLCRDAGGMMQGGSSIPP